MTNNGDGTWTLDDGTVVDMDGNEVVKGDGDGGWKYPDPGEGGGDGGGESTTGGWTENSDGTWTSPEGRTYSADGAEIGGNDSGGGGTDFTVGWAQNDDGSWTYTDDNGDMQRINEDGSEWKTPDANKLPEVDINGKKDRSLTPATGGTETEDDGLTPEERIAKLDKESRKDAENNAPGAIETIGGMTYRQQPDGSWEGDDGSVFTDKDYKTYKDSETAINTDSTGKINSGGSDTGKVIPPEVKVGPDGKTLVTKPDGSLLDKLKKPNGTYDWDKIKKLIPALAIGAGGIDALTGGDKGPKGIWDGTVDMGRNVDGAIARMQGAVSNGVNNKGIGAIPVAPKPDINPLVALPRYTGDGGMGVRAPTADEVAKQKADGTYDPNVQYAEGSGTQAFARGGPTQPRYLQGATDGMADKVPARIDGGQEARLAHGEFVIPADVVSHLGNGNSDAGATKLYDMMSKLRKARTGNPKQGKQINPDAFLPGMGKRKMASGGITDAVAHFDTGGVTAPTGLSSWAGPYVPIQRTSCMAAHVQRAQTH
jgi:hypothetical protein